MKQVLLIAGGVFLGIGALLIVLNFPGLMKQFFDNQREIDSYRYTQTLSREDVLKRCGPPVEEDLVLDTSVNSTYRGAYGQRVNVTYDKNTNHVMIVSGSVDIGFGKELFVLPCLAKGR